MVSDTGGEESTMLSPDEAFSILGNETRIEILQHLGEADGPLSFTDLRNRVGIRRGGQFNYHLDKVVGHFVEKSDDGYALRQPGHWVIAAVLSGAVTEAPVFERTQINQPCQLCGAPIEVRFSQERVETFCTECAGMWGRDEPAEHGFLGAYWLPPAGVLDRTPEDLFVVAWTWTQLEMYALASDICPQCSATVETELGLCEDHAITDGLCTDCGDRYAATVQFQCTNCLFARHGTFPLYLVVNTDFLDVLTTQGFNPIFPDVPAAVQRVYSNYDEEIRSVEPFEARFTFTVDGESLTLTVDDDLRVISVTRSRASDPG